MRTDARGVALVDLVAALSVCFVLSAMAVPVIGGTLERERTIVAAHFLSGHVQRARLESLRRNTAVAVRLVIVEGRANVQLFIDGNGNGVLQRDIDRSIDPPLTTVQWLDEHARGVDLRINQPVAEIEGSGTLAPGEDPLRIGRTSLLAFSPLGTSSSGTMYVAAERGPQMAIRVYGATGRVRVLMFEAQTRQWRP